MLLRPCDRCRRHVSDDTTRCPFCDAVPGTLGARLIAHAGRVSRAAIFASAAACGATSSNPNPPPPPPPPLDPVTVQQFATAPPPAAGKGSVRGFVTLDERPLTGVKVWAQPNDGGEQLETTTGPHGEYSFVDIEPGEWNITAQYELPRYRPQDYVPPPTERVRLGAAANERVDIRMQMPHSPPPDRGPCCKPYGAPPARRRVV